MKVFSLSFVYRQFPENAYFAEAFDRMRSNRYYNPSP